MNHIGTQEIKTERLLLRKVRKSDYKDMYKFTAKEEVAICKLESAQKH